MSQLTALPYPGGKSLTSRTGPGRAISELLPYDPEGMYCEPFAGMLGQLLARPPSRYELVNDLDKRVVNWWTVVREQTEELMRVLYWTPNSRAELAKCSVDEGDDLERARRFTVVCTQSVKGAGKANGWQRRFSAHTKPTVSALFSKIEDGRVYQIAKRIRHIQLECRDGFEICERVIREPRALVYVDPPYRVVGDDLYRESSVDHDALERLLIDAKAKVAISGYPNDYPDLHNHPNWRRYDIPARMSLAVSVKSAENVDRSRVECLWTNY